MIPQNSVKKGPCLRLFTPCYGYATLLREDAMEGGRQAEADGGTVWSGLAHSKKPVKTVSVGFGRFNGAGPKSKVQRPK